MSPLLHLNLLLNSEMTKTWCIGGRHMSKTKNINEFEKLNPKTKKLVAIIKGSLSICGRNKSQIFTK